MIYCLVLIYFVRPWFGIQLKQTLESRDIINFDVLEKGLGIVSLPNVRNISRKMFLMIYSINWSNFIVWLPLLLEILGNMCIAIVCFPLCDVTDFEINLIFLIKPFFYMSKMLRQVFMSWERKKLLRWNKKQFS